MGDEGDIWRAVKEQRKKEKEAYDERVWPVIRTHLDRLKRAGFEIKKLTEYQYRINNWLDIYPENKRYHDIRENKRGIYKNMVGFVSNFFERRTQ